jgi:hypothetical protein
MTTAHNRQLLADIEALEKLDQRPIAPAPITCAACAHFEPDQHNRMAGMGFCPVHHGWNYPMQKRHCREFTQVTDGAHG